MSAIVTSIPGGFNSIAVLSAAMLNELLRRLPQMASTEIGRTSLILPPGLCQSPRSRGDAAKDYAARRDRKDGTMRNIRPIVGGNVWCGGDTANSSRWPRRLTPVQLAELEGALTAARARGLGWEEMTANDFPLPGFAALIDDIRDELENGSGLLMLRGIDPARYTLDEARIVYAGIARQLGTLVFSNRGGEIMRDIRDVGADVGKRYGELSDGKGAAFLSSYSRTLSSGSLRYHTDRCDVVSLFCIRQAMKGGVSKLCSSPAVRSE